MVDPCCAWLPLPAVWGCKGHSLVFETGETIPAEALFLEYREASGEILTPELFPRADGTTWVCPISTTGPVPVDPATNGFGYWIPALARVNGVPADLVGGVPVPGSAGMTGTGRCGMTRQHGPGTKAARATARNSRATFEHPPT